MVKSSYDIDPVVLPEQPPQTWDGDEIRMGDTRMSITGGQTIKSVTIDADYDIKQSDYILFANADMPITVNMPNPAKDRQIWIKNLTVNTVTIEGGDYIQIDGGTQYLLSSQYDAVLLHYSGIEWSVMATK